MDPRLLLMLAALRARAHASELALASRAAQMNAEALEVIVCDGTDEEVIAAVKVLPQL